MEKNYEDEFYDMAYKVDKLSQLLNLAVAIFENRIEDDEDIRFTFLSLSEMALNEYYQSKLPLDQFKKLNKGVK